MIQDIMPGTEEQLSTEMTSGYIGFDPTADSLHIGSLVPILLLVHLQKAGHKPFVLLGGATGMVGDPSGKSEERNLLDEETLNQNLRGIRKQLERFLDFDQINPNAAELVNNYDWFKEMYFLDFITGRRETYYRQLHVGQRQREKEAGRVCGYEFYRVYISAGTGI